VFPRFRIGVSDLQFVAQFKYLGHIRTRNLSDDNDIQREVRSMFVRCNILIRKLSNCSRRVKLKLFQSYSLCFYDIALWYLYSIGSLSKFRSCYNKCIKLFLGTRRITNITTNITLPRLSRCTQQQPQTRLLYLATTLRP